MSEANQSNLRRIVSPGTKSRVLQSPGGPRPISKHNFSSEKGPIQVAKAATEPISAQHASNERWTSAETVSSPKEYSLPTSPDSLDVSFTKLEPVRQTSFEPLRSGTPTSVASAPVSGAKLWETLRHHVLTPPSRPSTPSQQTARSGTPKPLFPKLGLRQLVDNVTSMESGMRKFAEEILRACNIARYGELQRPTREREGSSSSQPSNSSARRLDYLRRPLSVASISSSTQASSPPSLRYLYQILVQYSTNMNAGQTSVQFPYENRVLSTLLCPFLSHKMYPVSRLEEEQLTAMDAFELLSNNWHAANEVRFCLLFVQMIIVFSPH